MSDTTELTQNDYPVNIEDLMHTAYLQYSLSVNVGRAIPDVRDGLKPVNRRILHVLRLLGLTHNHSHSKCATVVGEVMGKYHPHGDQAIYDTLVRMAQGFSMRYPLVDGQGNFGTPDGDPPAAMRYTECRMHRLGEELLTDIDKDTVDFLPTFDEVRTEPVVLPARFPNLLVNGSTGIGVGMATNIPPHNLAEVINATVHLIDFPQSSVRDLMQHVKGPDFPTGATIVGVQPIVELYETGHSVLTVRAKVHTEERPGGGERLVVTEVPYGVNKEQLVKRIAELVNDKVLTGIADVRDLSSARVGTRMVIDIKRNDIPNVVLNQLYKHTSLQSSFGCQFLVVDHNRPRTMNLVQILQAYVDHRFEVITRRCRFELQRAEERLHIVEGLLIAVDNIDEVVRIIRASATRDDALSALISNFGLSRRQGNAILDMRLSQLTGLARDELKAEHDDLIREITHLKELLSSRELLMGVVKTELIEVRDRYADERRTNVIVGENEINIEDMIKRSISCITVTNTGYIKRQPVEAFRTQRRGGRGVMGMQTKEEDFVEHIFTACTHDYILFFTNRGQMHWLKVYEVPEAQRVARGKAIINLIQVEPNEFVRAMVTVPDVDDEETCLVFATRRGYVKKTQLSEFKNLRRVGIRAIHLGEDDDLISVRAVKEDQQLMLFSRSGMACRFVESDARPMGRVARGVIGMRLRDEADGIVAMLTVEDHAEIVNISAGGMGKRSNIGTGIAEIDQGAGYRLSRRGSIGVMSIRLREGDHLVGACRVEDDDELIVTTVSGQVVRFRASDIRTIGRASQGVRVMNLRDEDEVVSVSVIATLPEEPEEGGERAEGEGAEGEAAVDGTRAESAAEAAEPPATEPEADTELAEDESPEAPEAP